MDFGIQVKVDPNGALPAIKRVEDGLTQAEKKAKEMSRELSSGLRHVGGAFGELANAIEMETRMLERATGRSRDFGQQISALEKLHRDGKITAEQYITTLQKMGVEFGHTAEQAAKLKKEQAELAAKTIGFGGDSGQQKKSGSGPSVAVGGLAVAGAAQGAMSFVDERKQYFSGREQAYADYRNIAVKFEDAEHSLTEILREQFDVATQLRRPMVEVMATYDGMRDATQGLGLSHRETIDLQTQLAKVAIMEGESIGAAVDKFHKLKVAFSAGADTGKTLQGMMKDFGDVADGWIEKFGGSEKKFLEMVDKGKVTFHDLVETTITGNSQVEESWNKRLVTEQQIEMLINERQKLLEGLGASAREQQHVVIDTRAAITKRWGHSMGETLDALVAKTQRFNKAAKEAANKDGLEKFVKLLGDGAKAADELGTSLDRTFSNMLGRAAGKTSGFMDKIPTDKIHAAIKEVDDYAEALKRIRGPGDDAIKQLNIIGQLHMNGRISLEEYNREYARLRDILVDIGRIEVKSVTGGKLNTSPIDLSGIKMPTEAAAGPRSETSWLQGHIKGYVDESRKANYKLAQDAKKAAQETREAWGEAAGSIVGDFGRMAMEGDRTFGEMLEASLQKAAMLMLTMAAGSMGGGVGAQFASGLFGALGGGWNGFDHVISGRSGLEMPGFATGGDAMIRGKGPQDSIPVAFWGSAGESLHVRTPQQRMAEAEWARDAQRAMAGGGSTRVTNNVIVSSDPREVTAAMGTYEGKRAAVRLNRAGHWRR